MSPRHCLLSAAHDASPFMTMVVGRRAAMSSRQSEETPATTWTASGRRPPRRRVCKRCGILGIGGSLADRVILYSRAPNEGRRRPKGKVRAALAVLRRVVITRMSFYDQEGLGCLNDVGCTLVHQDKVYSFSVLALEPPHGRGLLVIGCLSLETTMTCAILGVSAPPRCDRRMSCSAPLALTEEEMQYIICIGLERRQLDTTVAGATSRAVRPGRFAV